MKTIFTLLAVLFFSTAALAKSEGSNTDMHRALCGLNRQWAKLPAQLAEPADRPLLTDKDWIQHHLSLVEARLRAVKPAGLTPQQRGARLRTLDVLHDYRLAGRFPQNETHAVRTPVFIDAYGTFCAVGFLLKESGAEALARSVEAKNNFIYLPDLYSPSLDAWADEHGFTRDELAWIQPTYSPMYYAASVGGGTNGSVSELLVSSDGQKLYVGGKFTHVDGALAAPNIAYVTENGGAYTWHNIGTGLEGPVTALVEWDGKLFAGGNSIISQGPLGGSVAFWTGTNWTMAGQTSGDVHDLAVFRDTLYAAGNFSTSSGTANLARWNGAQWVPITGLSGTVYTLEAVGAHLFLGGNFRHNADSVNAIRWSSNTSFIPFANRMVNEVRDFEVFKDTVYASCRLLKPHLSLGSTTGLGGSDTNMVCRLVGNNWVSSLAFPLFPMNYGDTLPARNTSINTLCSWNDSLLSAGDLAHYPMVGTAVHGMMPIVMPAHGTNWFLVDSAIAKLAVFKGSLFAGGRMKGTSPWSQLNGICRQVYTREAAGVKTADKTSSNPSLLIHPNPAKAGSETWLTAPFPAKQIRLLNATGRTVFVEAADGEKQLSIPAPTTPGRYIIEWMNSDRKSASGVLVVQ